MKDYIEERAVEIAYYIIENKATVRQTAVLMSTLRKRKLKKLQTILSDTVMLRLRQVIISLLANKRLLIAE